MGGDPDRSGFSPILPQKRKCGAEATLTIQSSHTATDALQ